MTRKKTRTIDSEGKIHWKMETDKEMEKVKWEIETVIDDDLGPYERVTINGRQYHPNDGLDAIAHCLLLMLETMERNAIEK